MRKIIVLLLLIPIGDYSQLPTKNIYGFVNDSNTGFPIEYCEVIQQNTANGTLTDKNGKFKINIHGDLLPVKLIFRAAGYVNDTITINKSQDRYSVVLKTEVASLDEIVVTGTAKAAFLKENPLSITPVSTKQIENTAESNIIDVLVKNVPGLNAVKTGPNISKPFINGLGYNRVLTLYDGIRQEGQQYGDEHGIEIDDYNISKAEVIKGPASLLYGSDAVAGVISFFPFIPTKQDGKLHGKLTSEYHTNNNLTGNGLRLDYANEKFMFALNGTYKLAKNYRNPIDNRVYLTNFNVKGISALAGYKSDKGYTHLNFTLYDNEQGIPDGSRDSLSRNFTKQIKEEDDITDRPIVSDNELNTYKIPDLSQHIQHYRLYTRNFYKIGGGDIDVLLGIQQNIRREYTHPEYIQQAGMYMRLNTMNYGIRYNAPKFGDFEISTGVNGMLQNNKNLDATDFPIPDYNLYEGGLYLFVKWKRNKWSVSGGLRYDLRQTIWDDFYVAQDLLTGLDYKSEAKNPDANLQYEAFEKLYHGISGSVGTTFQLNRNISFKFNIGRAYRSPNITEIGSNGLDPGAHIIYLGDRSFVPEFSLQEDAGVMFKFQNVSSIISLFNNNIQNYIYMALVANESGNPIIDDQGNRTYQYRQSNAQIYGIDFWLSVHPKKLSGFRWNNNFSIINGFNRKPEFKGKGVDGEYLPLISPAIINSGILYEIEIKRKYFVSITPKVEVAHSAAQNKYLGLNNTETRTASYTLLNAGLITEIKNSKAENVQIVIQVNNLLNKAYQSHLNRLKYFEHYSNSPTGHAGIYNMGRNFIAKIIIPF